MFPSYLIQIFMWNLEWIIGVVMCAQAMRPRCVICAFISARV